ncbi:MAG: GH92 family glycosyl hydrolase [Acidobacteriota bacterium]|nr:GH92 family glycosyl hydrolase [Acidobacteriota bacterium]
MKIGCRILVLLCLAVFFALGLQAQTKRDLTRYVNPFIGTGAHGHTFPGATVPHGFVQLSPDTREANWDGSGGYHYSDSIIYGFSHTHLSGTGIPDYCDILFAPYISKEDFWQAKQGDDTTKGFASRFSHDNEKAEAGYYSVLLQDENILAEMTATARAGFHRYTFPETTNEAKIALDLAWRDKVLDSEIKIVGNNRIEGFRRSESWAKDQIVYFVAEFSKPFETVIVKNTGVQPEIWKYGEQSLNTKGKNIKASFSFKTAKGEKILLKVGISAVDVEGARRNLKAEIPDWNFEKVRQEAKRAWQKELSSIEVSGGTEAELTNFYTALYHTKIAPNVFQDVDGRFRGLDKKIHQVKGFTNYTVFSLWDTFRAAHPLYTIVDQKRSVDFINTFLAQYEQGGRLPVWELAGEETDTMIGYHAVSVIADAMAKGIKGFDYEKAFAASKHSAELNHFGLEAYKRRGYISMEDENESVSKTLEYAYNDFCIAQMARILGKKDDYEKYIQRSRYFENLFDAETGFMRPKQNGGFVRPFEPQEVTFHFTEANSWQYSFFVPHDVSRLIELSGGRTSFIKKLDELFTTDAKLSGREQPDITGLIGQYAHGNEPSHHIAYLYNYAGAPEKTQFYARKIMDEFYRPTPDGLIGNEDCGQMSAWYVLSSLGFYQVNPSNPIYAFGTPLFKEARINLENGKTFTIKAPAVSPKGFYIKSVRLNGKPHTKAFITHDEIMRGGSLEFEMVNTPVKNAFSEMPISAIEREFTDVPLIEAGERVFKDKTEIRLKSVTPNALIYFTTDGSIPDAKSARYQNAFSIDRTTTIKAVAMNEKGLKSLVAEAVVRKKTNDWTVKIFSKYSSQYTGGGDEGLIDGIRGTTNFAAGAWQGYQGQDFVAVIDLQRETEIKSVGSGFLQVARSWIWMPTRIEFEASNDGTNYRPIATIRTDLAPENMENIVRDYRTEIAPTRARFVRVTARNLGKIPTWHPGAGNNAYIFVDEIFIR